MKKIFWLLLIVSNLLANHLARGMEPPSSSEPSFYQDKARGWFWHEEKLEPEPEPEPEPIKPKPVTEINLPPPEKPKEAIKKPEPATMSAEWFRKNLDKYRDKAIDDPSRENVAAFYYLQRVMLDKATKFTDVAKQVVMSDPMLDENTRRPLSTAAVNEANRESMLTTNKVLSSIAKKAGILFFFRSDCRYCEIEAPILSALENTFGFKVYAVSLDGKPMPGGFYTDFHTDDGQAGMLGVVSTPAVFMLKPPSDIAPITQGVLAMDELVGRIIMAARTAGWIDEESFDKSRGQNRVPSIIPSPTDITPEMMENPVDMINAIRRQARYTP